MNWEAWFAHELAARESAGLRRSLQTRGSADGMIDLAGNDYLGLGSNGRVRRAAAEAALEWGAGSGASRLVTGSLELHRDLERELADFVGAPSALVFSTGYHANLSIVTALAGRDAVVVSDAHVHASLVDAARLSRAEIRVVTHNDVAAVRTALAGLGERRAVVLVESVYSVLGDAAPLGELAAVCRETGAMLVVDEAHGLGVVGFGGRGLVHSSGLAGSPHVVVTATLSKALGTQGGVVFGSSLLTDHLVNRARPFIFDTGLAPPAAAGAWAALTCLREDPGLPATIHRRTAALAGELQLDVPAGAVLSVPMASPDDAVLAQAELAAAGVKVGCFRPPSVPDGVSRLRVTANAGLADREWDRATELICQLNAVRLGKQVARVRV